MAVAVEEEVREVPALRVEVGVFVEVVEREGREEVVGAAEGVLEEEEEGVAMALRVKVRVGRGVPEEEGDTRAEAVAEEDLELVVLAVKVAVRMADLEEVVEGVTVLVPVVVLVAVFVELPELVDCPVPVGRMEGFTPTNARSRPPSSEGGGYASTRPPECCRPADTTL